MDKTANKVYFDFITLLKFIAIVMITNSHIKWMYPEALSSFACGGAWGCTIFFFCSGFTMAQMKTDNWGKYVLKRVLRIYPAIWIWYLFSFTSCFNSKYNIVRL